MEQPRELVEQILVIEISGHRSVFVSEGSLHGLALERAQELGDCRYGPLPDLEIKNGLDDCGQGPPLALGVRLPRRCSLPPTRIVRTTGERYEAGGGVVRVFGVETAIECAAN